MSNNNASDRELLELVLAQVSKLTIDMDGVKSEIKGMKSEIKGMKSEINGIKSEINGIKSEINGIKSEVKEIKSEVGEVKKTVVKIEHEHGEKLAALFDGYKQNSDKLDRIEAEVSKHEEVILRRIR